MGITILTVIAVLAFIGIVFRLGPDKEILSSQPAKWFVYAALVLMGLYAGFLLFFGVGEMASGDPSGIIHLLPAVLIVVMMFLAWRRPTESGAVLVLIGLLSSLYYGLATMQGGRSFQPTSLLGGAPYLLAGILCLVAAALARRQAAGDPGNLSKK